MKEISKMHTSENSGKLQRRLHAKLLAEQVAFLRVTLMTIVTNKRMPPADKGCRRRDNSSSEKQKSTTSKP
jgi:hypothetical protein